MSTGEPDEEEIAPPPERIESARPHRRLRRGSRSGSGISASFVGNCAVSLHCNCARFESKQSLDQPHEPLSPRGATYRPERATALSP